MKLHRIAGYQLAAAALAATVLTGCATGKSIGKADDIRDDGKSNVVLLTYDVKLFATDKFPTDKSTSLNFHCPENSALNRNNCFSITVPYKGRSEYDGYDLHAFESNGAKVMKMKYNALSVTSGRYKVLIDEQRRTKCTYSKKTRKQTCYPVTDRQFDTHRFSLPDIIPITVTPGSGCYIGHLSIVMVNQDVSEYEFQLDAELTPEKLTNLDSGISNAIQQFVDRPCY